MLDSIKAKEISLTGIYHKKKIGKIGQDFLFFLILIALPSSFFAFLPTSLFYDIRLIFWLLGMVYGIFYFKYIKKINHIIGGKSLIILSLFVIFRFVYSIFVNDIPVSEVVTIFRTNFHYPITALGFLLYAASMNNDRLNRFMHWLFYTTLIFGTFYIFSNITGLNYYAVITKENSEEFLKLGQNLAALPVYIDVLFVCGLITAFTTNNSKYHLWWIIPLVLAILSIIRSLIVSYLIIFFIFFVIGSLYFKEIRFTRVIKFFFIMVLFTLLTSIVFSKHINVFIEKFGFNQEQKVQLTDYVDQGTYAVRLTLIEDAYKRIEQKGNILLGNGYVREAQKGSYDFVVGTDTFIAPVLYTEGFTGIILRIVPIFIFLRFGLKKLKNINDNNRYFGLFIVLIIIPNIINPVQTDIFVRFTNSIFILYLFMLYLCNEKISANIKKT